MPSVSSITVNDRATTPVAHTFAPDKEDNGVWVFRESTGVVKADPTITLRTRRLNGKIRTYLGFRIPVVQTETINGISAPKLVRTAYATLELTFDENSSLQERKDAVGMFANACASSQTMVDAVLTKAEGLY
jgi:hypothetical protein